MRYIDADALETHEQLEPCGNGKYEYVEVVYKDDIDNAPTIEPERKVGKWIYDADGLVWCNVCGFGKERSDDRVYLFCPNCGTKMKEGERDG